MEKIKKSMEFTILQPGGNDTCLINTESNLPSLIERKLINDFVQKVYPNVEQVGFVKFGSNGLELMMAGGEFCGNATRSVAYQFLKGEPGEINIKVSGVDKKLRAGVSSNGEAFAQMPIYNEISKITKDSKTGYIVKMKGITQYIEFDTTAILGLSSEEIKLQSMNKIREKGLNNYPAAGIIYVTENKDSFKIDPVVYVKEIDTLFYETACGSGTTALGLVKAIQKGESIKNMPVIQPSGMSINVSVDFDGEFFNYAQIQGKIDRLDIGSIEIIGDVLFATEQINTVERLQKELADGLTDLYKKVFSEAPYFEKFSDEEVLEIFEDYVSNGILFLAKNENGVIGFGVALPISFVPELSQILDETGKDINKAWYMAELGVEKESRRKGIGKKLVLSRLDVIPKGSIVYMRTSIENIASQTLYKSIGFEQIPNVFQEVEQKRINGLVTKDRRIFLEKVI